MEQKIKEVESGLISQSSYQGILTPTYDHIVLTEEETEKVLREARRVKAAKLEEVAYLERLNKPKEYAKFSFESLREFILSRNQNYILDEDNTEQFELLLQYFTNDPAFELSGEYSLSKGIMLNGPVGCGKTQMMRMFGFNSFRPFAVTACRSIADAYQRDGVTALNKYSDLLPVYPQKFLGFDVIGHCFDDLGTEDDKKNFGNQVNVMQDILFKVYDQQLTGCFHMTTNLDAEAIEAMYGGRIRSRMREMFNNIKFSKKSKDRRK